MEIDLNTLPIPDWDVRCPRCKYPLRGLPAHRCPECGAVLDMQSLVRTWTRLREPQFTGRERPLPDFGLRCGGCGASLAGAAESQCAVCGRAFDVEAARPARRWFLVDRDLTGELPLPIVEMLLETERVPFVVYGGRTAVEIYMGSRSLGSRILVDSDFYFDVRWLLQRERSRLAARRAGPEPAAWRCEACGEDVPGHFDVCWNCQTPAARAGE